MKKNHWDYPETDDMDLEPIKERYVNLDESAQMAFLYWCINYAASKGYDV